ncbi:hypothetical protein FOCC_FOCC006994 [Frankliniella occidentalis]|nr:hypothetical protein FOCC_FOCC006994 [Frankliniella occidentalis]
MSGVDGRNKYTDHGLDRRHFSASTRTTAIVNQTSNDPRSIHNNQPWHPNTRSTTSMSPPLGSPSDSCSPMAILSGKISATTMISLRRLKAKCLLDRCRFYILTTRFMPNQLQSVDTVKA